MNHILRYSVGTSELVNEAHILRYSVGTSELVNEPHTKVQCWYQ